MSKIKVMVMEPRMAPYMTELDNSLEALQQAVGGYIECFTFATDAAIICNEEGRLMGLPYNRTLLGVDFVGTILIAGVKGEEFADLPADWIAIMPNQSGGEMT